MRRFGVPMSILRATTWPSASPNRALRDWLSKIEPYLLLGLQNPDLVKIEEGAAHLSANIACRLRWQPPGSAGASIVMFTASKNGPHDLSKLTAEEQHAYYLETWAFIPQPFRFGGLWSMAG
jgi:hypothetical protein